ncbi:hypothetical protein ACIF70_27275 [Actinacidiphila glaucinigra]|uniref:hypothetical protein n=1 Tax=Actinacidiphila glaucinigra TaxID=235986 RepID=UPI0037C59166
MRRLSTTPAGAVAVRVTELDAMTPDTVAGTSGPRESDPSVDVVPRGTENIAWPMAPNPGTQSVTPFDFTSTVAVTTAKGTLTVLAGTELRWSVDGDQVDGRLAWTLRIGQRGTGPHRRRCPGRRRSDQPVDTNEAVRPPGRRVFTAAGTSNAAGTVTFYCEVAEAVRSETDEVSGLGPVGAPQGRRDRDADEQHCRGPGEQVALIGGGKTREARCAEAELDHLNPHAA